MCPTFREAKPEDIKEMLALLEELFEIEEDFTFNEHRARHGLTLLLESKDAKVFVAQAEGAVVGMVSVQVLISTAEGGHVGLIEDLVVSWRHKGRGLGGFLLKCVEYWAEEQGLRRLQILADRTNEAALSFYEKNHWQGTHLVVLRKAME